MTEEDITAVMGYASVLTYMVDNCLDVEEEEDIKDAFVEILMHETHVTDEELDLAVVHFRKMQAVFRA